MTIIVVADIEFQANSGWVDPALPIAIWRVGVRVDGDASGGNRSVQVNLKAAGVPPGNVFSLEQIAGLDTDATATDDIQLNTAGMQVWNPATDNNTYGIPMRLLDSASSLVIPTDALPRPLWFGRAADAGTAGALTFTKANANTEAFQLQMAGYMWSPRSISAGGGFRRPVDGQFSA